jgi:hypothetical protein
VIKAVNLGLLLHAAVEVQPRWQTVVKKIDEQRQNLILADSWFSSVKLPRLFMKVEMNGSVMSNLSNLFSKQDLENKLKTWPSGMNLTLEAMASKGVTLIAIGYKYNSSNVLCLLATKMQVQQSLVILIKHAFWMTLTI